MSPGFYQCLLWIARPLVHLRLRLRARKEPDYGQRIAERFGHVPEGVGRGYVWIHTVSAGESIAAAPFVAALADQHSDIPFLVTTMTPTGSEQVTTRLGERVDHCYAPYDFKDAVTRFFDRVQPRLLVLMETELWPNVIRTAAERDVPVVLVNARLSERSARGYQRLGRLVRDMLSRLDHVACQTPDHRDRFIGLGVAPQNITVTGSVKYDVSLPEDFDTRVAALLQRFNLGSAPVWIAASTHPGEEEAILAAHAGMRERIPGLRLILVPRHPVRCDDVQELVERNGLSVVRQSAEHPDDTQAEVILGDVMGTLQVLYGLAQVAYVGGSLVDVGGHNPIEAALVRVPVLCGPHQYNFIDVMHSLESAGALCTITSAEDLAQVAGNWLVNANARQQAGEAGFAVVEQNRGAQARIEALVAAQIRVAFSQTD